MNATEPNTKNQHYVWRHYLTAWAQEGVFYCYRQKDRKLFPTRPKVIANQTYFYEVQHLTEADEQFLEDTIKRGGDERLRELNHDYVKMTQLPFKLRELIAGGSMSPNQRDRLEAELRWAERNLIERYHTGIENKCQDILENLRRGEDGFYQDEGRCGQFLYFLSLQYFRTSRMRTALSAVPTYVPGHDPTRTAAILNHIHATNVSAGLFRERRSYRIIFLANDTPTPFIAGDQPVVNMLDPHATTDLEFYYPLSPKLAMLLTKNTVQFPDSTRRITAFEAERYNYAIYSKSDDQVYSNDAAYLAGLIALEKTVLAR